MRRCAREILRRIGLLEAVRAIRGSLHPPFIPAKPLLLIAVNKSLLWRRENGQAEEAGDYLEFGIYRGFTLWYAQALAQELGLRNMRFFGFDSFQGLPSPAGIDKAGVFSAGDFRCSRRMVEAFLTQHQADWARTFLIEGWFEKTLTPQTRARYNLTRCSLCVIDCDLYGSARLVLQFIEPLIGNGSILLFDDWVDFGDNPARGEQKAFAEFLGRNPRLRAESFTVSGYNGRGFVLKTEDV